MPYKVVYVEQGGQERELKRESRETLPKVGDVVIVGDRKAKYGVLSAPRKKGAWFWTTYQTYIDPLSPEGFTATDDPDAPSFQR